MWPGDQLDIDGEAFGGLSHRKREPREAGKVEPLAETHGVAVIVRIIGAVVAGPMMEGRRGGNRRKKNGDFAELPEE